MTEQEAFDKAVAGLASQGFERCGFEDEHGTFVCRYNHGTMHCAAGWVLPPEITRRMEGNGASYVASRCHGFSRLGPFLDSLQDEHDYSADAAHMKFRLRHFGRERGLTIPAVLEA